MTWHSARPLPPDPAGIEEMIPVRLAEIAARRPPRCGQDRSHGELVPVPLAGQTYERMFAGVWYACPRPGCSGNGHWYSRELAAYHAEPYSIDGQGQFELWDGDGWVAISRAMAEAIWRGKQPAAAPGRHQARHQARQRAQRGAAS